MWPIEGISDAFKKSATAPDGKQYFVPISYYPWAVFYRKSVFEKNGWAVPTTMDEMTALMKDMQGEKLTPIAFAAKDAWAPMGTFDILNMRLNGYDFHIGLMAGQGEVGQRRGQERLHDVEGHPAPVPAGERPRPHLAGGRHLDGQG